MCPQMPCKKTVPTDCRVPSQHTPAAYAKVTRYFMTVFRLSGVPDIVLTSDNRGKAASPSEKNCSHTSATTEQRCHGCPSHSEPAAFREKLRAVSELQN